MLQVHYSNRVEALAGQLAGQVGGVQPDPFQPDHIIVPSVGLRRWLTLQLAHRQGLCANVQFGYLASWLWQCIGQVVPAFRDESPFAVPVLTWHIDAELADAGWVGRYPRLAGYLLQADPVMQYELAAQLAQLYDQFATYRPDWLSAWRQGRQANRADQPGQDDEDAVWQANLWRRLVARIGVDDTAPLKTFFKVLSDTPAVSGTTAIDGNEALSSLPATIHLFCLPTIAPEHLLLLQALARQIDVHLYALNPCEEYWFDLVDEKRLAWLAAHGKQALHETGHRLLAGWGQQAQSHLSRLIDLDGQGAVEQMLFEAPHGSDLLSRLQDSILKLDDLQPGEVPWHENDQSIQVHVCHSLTREIEVLHDRLLAMFSAQPAGLEPLRPDQVLVVTPDLELAAPLIDAVFGTAPPERHIAYTITGRARSQNNPAARLLLDLLALMESRFGVTRVLMLLRQPMVARRFGVDRADLDRIQFWLREAGVHWALDAVQLADQDLPTTAAHTFADGLDRLFLGYALPSAVDQPMFGQLPAGNAEGTEATALGAFWLFVETLTGLRADVLQARSASAWRVLLTGALQAVAEPSGQEHDELAEAQQAIEDLCDAMEGGKQQASVPLSVLRAALVRQLDDPVRGGVPVGRVCFSSMTSLRSLPYRVICVIGLNDGAYPSPARPDELDLMRRHPRPGDRERRLDERNLFLDLILAAREVLYLSHVGRSVRDNSFLPSSVLLSQLLEYLLPVITGSPQDATALTQARRHLVTEHPLQPFSPEAFNPDSDSRLRSFNSDYAQGLLARHEHHRSRDTVAVTTGAARVQKDTVSESLPGNQIEGEECAPVEQVAPFFIAPLPPPGDEWLEVSLEQLVRFFRNPCRYLLERRLGLNLWQADDELSDDEPFLLDLPARSALAARLLPALMAGDDPERVRALARSGRELPDGDFGQQLLHLEWPKLVRFADELAELVQSPVLEPHGLSLVLQGGGRRWHFQAGLADLRAEGLVRQRYDDRRATDYLGAWLHHLALCTDPPAGVDCTTRVVARRGGFRFDPVDASGARQRLENLLALYAQGLREPLRFFPKSAWVYVSLQVDDRKSEEETEGIRRAKAMSKWQVTRFNPWGEQTDAAYRLALRGLDDPLQAEFETFASLAHRVFDPLCEHLVEWDHE